jgi:hypothetical protein
MGWREADLRARRKGKPRKIELAGELRSQTTMPLAWLAERLNLGTQPSMTSEPSNPGWKFEVRKGGQRQWLPQERVPLGASESRTGRAVEARPTAGNVLLEQFE